ncbi:MAG: hypothetical protein RIC80_17695, partial [Cyclobacteriaceae bacterium]
LNEDVRALAEKVSGQDLSEFFKSYVDGLEPLEHELGQLLTWVGLKMDLTYPEDQLMSYLGLKTQSNTAGNLSVTSTVPESLGEAYFTAGDEIIAINGSPAKSPFKEIKVGPNSLEITRLGKKLQIEVEVETKAYYGSPKVSIHVEASEAAHYRRAQWLRTQKDD